MYNSKIITYLKSLDKPELNRFEKFVESPYFCTNKYVQHLFKLIKPHYPSFTSSRLGREKIFNKIYPQEVFDDAKIRRLSTDLVKLFDAFLIVEEMNKKEDFSSTNKDLLLLELKEGRHLLKNNSYKEIQKETSKIYQRLEMSCNPATYLHQYEVARFAMERSTTIKRNMETSKADMLELASKALDYYYLTQKMRLIMIPRQRAIIVNEDYQLDLVDTVLWYGKEKNLREIPFFDIYHRIYYLLEATTLEAYPELKELVLAHLEHIEPNFQSEIILLIYNIFIKWHRQTSEKLYLEELFFWDQQILNRGLLDIFPTHMRDFYVNHIKAGASLGKFKEANQFLQDYKAYIPEAYRKDIAHLCQAQLDFHQQQFKAAKQSLNAMTTDIELKYKIKSDILYIQVYYELGEDPEPLYSRIKSFRDLLNRRNILKESRKNQYKAFLKYVSLLLKEGGANREIDAPTAKLIQEKMKVEESAIYEKTWILEKLTQMIKTNR